MTTNLTVDYVIYQNGSGRSRGAVAENCNAVLTPQAIVVFDSSK
jgi:hypothetical protein